MSLIYSPYNRHDPEQLNSLLYADVIISFAVTCTCALFVVRFSQLNPYLVGAIFCGVGLITFYIELGGFHCMGNCGLPLWYDVFSIAKVLFFPLMIGWIGNRLRLVKK